MQRLSKYEYVFSVTLTKQLNDKVLRVCAEKNTSKTELVRMALKEYFIGIDIKANSESDV